jgi:hypothetical protein
VQSHIDDKKEAVNDHPELSDAIKSLKESALIGTENVLKIQSSETDANKRVVDQLKKLIDEVVVEEN